ncbi:hypothetical protein PVL29_017959 [Vitis rotundifolia]|uniref:Bidirectional sugar transporter SWEET n=1 Tax=Vitis rotundifolia TaxID=103349 RepID=A0AA38Z3Q9_VITRO|nr:hypothetical protein PVL29_017959 [Vitis rotundifolia]
MASLSFIIGIIGNVISILVFTSPIGTFRQVVKKKSTENYKGIPYITTLLATSLWTFYGFLKPGGLLVITVNATGAIMQFIYVTLFLIYAPRDVKIQSMKLAAILDVGFLGAVILITLLAFHGRIQLIFVGVFCAGLTIGMYASPLSAMVPNAVGFVLGSAQLILYAVYRNKSRPSATSEERVEEEGSARLVKRAVEMQASEDDGKASPKNHSLSKGRSLPVPFISRQHSLQKMMKTLSWSPYGLHDWQQQKDIEKGDI